MMTIDEIKAHIAKNECFAGVKLKYLALTLDTLKSLFDPAGQLTDSSICHIANTYLGLEIDIREPWEMKDGQICATAEKMRPPTREESEYAAKHFA